jgi:hypothetical protein
MPGYPWGVPMISLGLEKKSSQHKHQMILNKRLQEAWHQRLCEIDTTLLYYNIILPNYGLCFTSIQA